MSRVVWTRLAVALLALEIGLRTFAPRPAPAPADPAFTRLQVDARRAFYRVEPLDAGKRRYETADRSNVYESFVRDPAHPAREMFLVGGSLPPAYVARSIPYPPSARLGALSGRPAVLRTALAPGHDALRDAGVIEEVAALRPAFVVLFSGHAEGRGGPWRNLTLLGARRALAHLRLLRWMVEPGSGVVEARPDPRRFEAQLRRAAAAARAAGATLVLVTLPSNLEFPPGGRLPLEDPDFAAGWVAWQAGDAAAAGAAFARFTARVPDDAFGQWYLGRATGEREALRRAVELDPDPVRARPSFNAITRRVAGEEGAALADLDAVFERAGARGWAAFSGPVEWRPRYDALVTETLAAAAAGTAPDAALIAKLRAEEPRPWLRETRWLKEGVRRLLDRKEARRDLGIDERALAYLDSYFRPAGTAAGFKFPWIDKAYALYDELAGEERWRVARAEIFLHFAELARRSGDEKRAVDLLDTVLEERPESARALILRGWALHALGRMDAAKSDFFAAEQLGGASAELMSIRNILGT